MNTLYLCGNKGVEDIAQLDEEFLTHLGFPLDTHEDIVSSIIELTTDWKTPIVNPKYTDSLKSLDSLETSAFVDWYSHFRIDLPRYNIGLVAFDALILKWESLGLSLPGIGELKYMAMSQPLFSLLVKVLPMSNPIVLQCYHAYGGVQHDGFKFLFSIMKRALPVFCPSIPVTVPKWNQHRDVSLMLKHWLLYFRFSAKTGSFFGPIERGFMLLESIREESLVGIIAGLRGNLQLFQNSVDLFSADEVVMPPHLTLEGLVETISGAQAPVTNSMVLATTTTPPIAFVNATSRSPRPSRRPSTAQDRVKTAVSPSKSDAICQACLKKGHEETQCRHLATLLVINKRLRSLPASVKQKVLQSYYDRHGVPSSAAVHSTYARQLDDFCDIHGISADDMAAQFDWDHYCAFTSASPNDAVEEEEFYTPETGLSE